ncbi:hypothetical protein CLPU_15c00610 [Gottschalkia purinilytica]|uniref:Uncharacterized protein n=1 Tax=Gottschalkia purinilytica TaxID=1503 RepID=A0A0L0W802_GOTPU|nr:hypothetical protein [Gottschalkia purinilytica]KNF07567.1 hypothetical protein CLPU_15c00610 [Gottschalkia purinilytica]
MLNYKKYIKKRLTIVIIVAIILAVYGIMFYKDEGYQIGAYIHTRDIKVEDVHTLTSLNLDKDSYDERFQRPSKEASMKLKYEFKDYNESKNNVPKGYPIKYTSPVDLIQAYYSILKEASNMEGFHGGCGTVGFGEIPYPFAYNLLSKETKKNISLKEFKESFKGTGHTTLLKLLPLNELDDTSKVQHYIVEIETITGKPIKDNIKKRTPTYFSYYYGIVTTKYDEKEGWKIQSIDYIPEDFLCAPYHRWQWDSKLFVETVYKDLYSIVDEIINIEQDGDYIKIYAKGGNNEYRFDFIRLTNGEDILLHEYMKSNENWEEVDLLKNDHKKFKLSYHNFKLEKQKKNGTKK